MRRGAGDMFLRIDRLQVEMPVPAEPDPNAAAT
jgi:Mn-containing catalase